MFLAIRRRRRRQRPRLTFGCRTERKSSARGATAIGMQPGPGCRTGPRLFELTGLSSVLLVRKTGLDLPASSDRRGSFSGTHRIRRTQSPLRGAFREPHNRQIKCTVEAKPGYAGRQYKCKSCKIHHLITCLLPIRMMMMMIGL